MMRPIFDLQTAPEPGSRWNKRGQDASTEAEVSRSVAALGAKLDELRNAETRPNPGPAEPQERNPKMAQETQRAHAAAAGAAGSTSTAGTFSQTRVPDAPKQASEPRSDYELVLGRGQIASCLFAGTVVVAIFAGGAYFAGKLSAMNCVAASNSIPQASAPLRVASVTSQENVPQAGVSPASIDPGVPSQAPVASQTGIAAAATKTAIVPFTLGAASAAAGTTPNTTTSNAAAPSAATPKAANVPKEIAAAASGVPALKTNASAQARATALPDEKGAKGAPLFANPQPDVLYLQVGAVDRGMATIIAEGLRQHGLTSFVAPGPSDKIYRVLVGPLANQDEYKRVKGQVDSIDVGNFAREFEK